MLPGGPQIPLGKQTRAGGLKIDFRGIQDQARRYQKISEDIGRYRKISEDIGPYRQNGPKMKKMSNHIEPYRQNGPKIKKMSNHVEQSRQNGPKMKKISEHVEKRTKNEKDIGTYQTSMRKPKTDPGPGAGHADSAEETTNQISKIINQAHAGITRTKGKEYAPTAQEIQSWINSHHKIGPSQTKQRIQ
jgi:hypothetical protein